MNIEKFQPVVTASAFVDEHPPAMWREGKGLMGIHGRLVPGRSGSFLFDACRNIGKEGEARRKSRISK